MSGSPTVSEHKSRASGPVRVAVVTVSDTRTPENDVSGGFLRREIEASGHLLHSARIVPDEPSRIEQVLEELVSSGAQVVLFNGGTGISRRDTTFDTLSSKFEKTLPGFGEIFRRLSFDEIGSAAMMSRAAAGVYRGAAVLSMPGSPAAVRLAWEKLIAPEIAHLAGELTR